MQNIMPFNLSHSFNYELKEVPTDIEQFVQAKSYLLDKINFEADASPMQLRTYFSMLSFVLKVLNELDSALHYAKEALAVSKALNIISLIVIDQMRYASVLQWQKKYEDADSLFLDAIHICKTYEPLYEILDFAYHNYGKSLYDQTQFELAAQNFQMAMEIRKNKNIKDLFAESEQALRLSKNKLQPN